MMQRFARWHIWLGWVVALPILLWALTGLVMVARPIEQVRGDSLRAQPAAIDPAKIAFPARIGEPIREARLVAQPGGPEWVVVAADGRQWRYSATTGAALSPLVEDEARALAEAAYAGDARAEKLTYFAPGEALLDARASGAVWQARFADGTNVYLDDATGELLALRTAGWRLYDFMYGLHVMDLVGHDDAHNPFVIAFALFALAGALLGSVLLFRRRKARVGA